MVLYSTWPSVYFKQWGFPVLLSRVWPRLRLVFSHSNHCVILTDNIHCSMPQKYDTLLLISSHLVSLSVCSVCFCGHMYILWGRKLPWLDVLLWLCGDVHVLLCTLANLCFWNAALWPVSRNDAQLYYLFSCCWADNGFFVFDIVLKSSPSCFIKYTVLFWSMSSINSLHPGLMWQRSRLPSLSCMWCQLLVEWPFGTTGYGFNTFIHPCTQT